ncbi:MAG: RNA polymerase sigma factor [Polyangiaceae bacterium]
MSQPSNRPLRANAALPSDADLLRDVAGGDRDALGMLYDRYARDVWRVACRMLGDRADADDVVHATFLDLRRMAACFDGRSSCRNWLRGIAVRLALRHRRGMGRFRRMLEGFGQSLVGSAAVPHPESQASHNEDLRILARALARLHPNKRAAFTLVALEGLTSDQAAIALEVPAATVRTRLFNARRELQAALNATTLKEP